MLARLWILTALLNDFVLGKVLHTRSRWIVDENDERYKLRCVNWAGHMETNIPEGLQHQPVDNIASHIVEAGFNCVRLTYSIDMALSPNVKVSKSFTQASQDSGVALATTTALYNQVVQNNPFVADATRLDVYSAVIRSLEQHGIDVVLDNHVSKAKWCCDLNDGNGWWDEATGYNALTSRYFNTRQWLNGLTAMAQYSASFPNVVGMSLRNELRSLPPQNLNGAADWYHFVAEGANRIHAANENILIMVGGTNGDLEMSFLRTSPLDRSPYDNKIVWEYHVYSYSPGYITSNCDIFKLEMGAAAGFLLEQEREFTGPLWVSEFGFGMIGGNNLGVNDQDYRYLTCLRGWLQDNDADWAYWPLQGDYYIRQGRPSDDESYGMLNRNWTGFRNADYKTLFGNMLNITQKAT